MESSTLRFSKYILSIGCGNLRIEIHVLRYPDNHLIELLSFYALCALSSTCENKFIKDSLFNSSFLIKVYDQTVSYKYETVQNVHTKKSFSSCLTEKMTVNIKGMNTSVH